MTLEEKKVPKGIVVEPRLREAIEARLDAKGKLSCAHAFRIAEALSLPPLTVGQAADALQIHLTRCQIGLFGYPQGKGWKGTAIHEQPIPEGLEAAIRAELDEQGHIGCAQIWAIAARMHLPKMVVGYWVDKLGYKITPCQLGAF